MHFASFDFADPVFDCFDLRVSAQLVTIENLYGIDPHRVRIEHGDHRVSITASGLRYAGGQQTAAGSLTLEVEDAGSGRVRMRVSASAGETIRCAKVLLRDLDPALATSTDGASFAPVGDHGELFGYPIRLPTPLLWLRTGDALLVLRAEDPRVREKRFALFQRAWWTQAPKFAQRYVRRFAHLCEGEPEGRTGVHEFGMWKRGTVAAAPGLLATIAFQDGTLARSRPAIEAAIAQAAGRLA